MFREIRDIVHCIRQFELDKKSKKRRPNTDESKSREAVPSMEVVQSNCFVSDSPCQHLLPSSEISASVICPPQFQNQIKFSDALQFAESVVANAFSPAVVRVCAMLIVPMPQVLRHLV